MSKDPIWSLTVFSRPNLVPYKKTTKSPWHFLYGGQISPRLTKTEGLICLQFENGKG